MDSERKALHVSPFTIYGEQFFKNLEEVKKTRDSLTCRGMIYCAQIKCMKNVWVLIVSSQFMLVVWIGHKCETLITPSQR